MLDQRALLGLEGTEESPEPGFVLGGPVVEAFRPFFGHDEEQPPRRRVCELYRGRVGELPVDNTDDAIVGVHQDIGWAEIIAPQLEWARFSGW